MKYHKFVLVNLLYYNENLTLIKHYGFVKYMCTTKENI